MKSIIATALIAASFTANAACYGSANVYSCTDLSGNTYNVQRYGNTTNVQGYNPNTGNSWSQQSHQYGNITNTYGNSSNGNSWSKTDTPYGSYGTNSNGQPFFYAR